MTETLPQELDIGLPHFSRPQTRREMLLKSGAGFGAIPLAALSGPSLFSGSPAHAAGTSDAFSNNLASSSPSAIRRPGHRFGTARSVIFLFMEGGPSHLDTFDRKPLLNELAGQGLPESFGTLITAMGEQRSPLLESPRIWKQHGECGTWVSDWLPETAKCVDDLTVIRSCWAHGINHSSAVCQMNTGSLIGGRPSLGSWITYGLGTENSDLPAFVVMQDGQGQVVNGPRNWSTGFMPALYQGVRIQGGAEPIPNLNTPSGVAAEQHLGKLNYLSQVNRRFASRFPEQTELEARIASYELAYRMQSEAPVAIDISEETKETQALYGIHQKATASFGQQCLMARRLVERGVRFVQLYHGAGSKWDAHSGIEKNHQTLCEQSDRPIAGLLRDLKQRGLLDETLVIWGGEFGRTPMSEKGNGRDHNPTGFTMWMAGGGLEGGRVIGETDDLGLRAVTDKLHVHDLHATILHLLGLSHMGLVYLHKGRPERPTLNEGEPSEKILGLA